MFKKIELIQPQWRYPSLVPLCSSIDCSNVTSWNLLGPHSIPRWLCKDKIWITVLDLNVELRYPCKAPPEMKNKVKIRNLNAIKNTFGEKESGPISLCCHCDLINLTLGSRLGKKVNKKPCRRCSAVLSQERMSLFPETNAWNSSWHVLFHTLIGFRLENEKETSKTKKTNYLRHAISSKSVKRKRRPSSATSNCQIIVELRRNAISLFKFSHCTFCDWHSLRNKSVAKLSTYKSSTSINLGLNQGSSSYGLLSG